MSKIKDQKSKMKIVELPQSGNDFLNFAFCTLIFAFLFAGCEQQREEDVDVLTLAQEAEVISIPSN
jgi:hypothetical protein